MGGVVQPYPTYINPHTPIKEREREKEKAESTRRGTRQFLTQEKEKQKKKEAKWQSNEAGSSLV